MFVLIAGVNVHNEYYVSSHRWDRWLRWARSRAYR